MEKLNALPTPIVRAGVKVLGAQLRTLKIVQDVLFLQKIRLQMSVTRTMI